jgi:hypothetical protein
VSGFPPVDDVLQLRAMGLIDEAEAAELLDTPWPPRPSPPGLTSPAAMRVCAQMARDLGPSFEPGMTVVVDDAPLPPSPIPYWVHTGGKP